MAVVKLIEKQETQEDVSHIFEMVEKQYGFVPNILKAIANCPDLLKSFVPFWASVYFSPDVGQRYRALAALGTAKTHDCKYCVAHMSASAKKAGLTNAEIEATGSFINHSILTQKEELIIEFASILTKDSGGVSDELLARMKSHFNDSELVNLALIVGVYNLTGRFLKSLRIDIEDIFNPEVELANKSFNVS